jgi:hypothetical protein
MCLNLAEFRATHAGKSLAGRTSDKYIYRRCNRTKAKICGQVFWPKFCNVAGLAMPQITSMEITPMRSGGKWVKLNSSSQFKAHPVKSERQTSTAGEKIEYTRTATCIDSGYFLTDWII